MRRLKKDELEKFHDYGVCPSMRTVSLEDEVDHESAKRVTKNLIFLDNSSSDGINLLISTPGGDEVSGLAIFDVITQCRNEVSATVIGEASSMGSIILQACHPRILMPNALMLLHYGTFGVSENHPQNVYRAAEWCKGFDRWMEDLYLSKIREVHPKYSRRKLKNLILFDKYVSAREAVNLGLADGIMGEE